MKKSIIALLLGIIFAGFFIAPVQAEESTFGYLTELTYGMPMDDDYCDLSECSIYSVFTEDELDILYRVVEAETPGCTYENHRNVANVIFNRLKKGWDGGYLIDILMSPNQFAVVTNGSYLTTIPTESTILAVEDAWSKDYTCGALYFNRETTKSYASKYCKRLFRDSCGHVFYKE